MKKGQTCIHTLMTAFRYSYFLEWMNVSHSAFSCLWSDYHVVYLSIIHWWCGTTASFDAFICCVWNVSVRNSILWQLNILLKPAVKGNMGSFVCAFLINCCFLWPNSKASCFFLFHASCCIIIYFFIFLKEPCWIFFIPV